MLRMQKEIVNLYLSRFSKVWLYPTDRTKVFIGTNVRNIRDCQNRKRLKPTKNISQQALVA